jgi:hypothetical protein
LQIVSPASKARIVETLSGELQKKSLTPHSVLAMKESERVALYQEFAKTLGLRATRYQDDIYGFFDTVLHRVGQCQVAGVGT